MIAPTMDKITEASLLKPVSDFIAEWGYRTQREEFQFYDYRIDLFGMNSESKKSIAIELKLRKWKRAIEQSLIYQLCSDLVFIALPPNGCKLVDREILEKHGIGMLCVSTENGVSQIVPAQTSKEIRDRYRMNCIRNIGLEY